MISQNVRKYSNFGRLPNCQRVIERCFNSSSTFKNLNEDSLKNARPFSEIPTPSSWPVIGAAWKFLPVIGSYDIRRQHLALREQRKLYGDIWRQKIGPVNVVISFQAEDMEAIFRQEGEHPNRGGLMCLKRYRESRKQWYTTIGLLLLQGKEWHDLRKKTQKHLMKPKAIEAYVGSMQDVAGDFVQRMQAIRDVNLEIPDFLQELYKWSLESVALVGLDARLGCFRSGDSDGLKMIKAVQIMFEQMGKLEVWVYIFKNLPLPGWRKFENAADEFSEIAFKYINKSLEELKKIDKNDDKGLTLLQALLATEGLEIGGAMVTVADMLLAGIDTTSHTVGFLLYELAKNQEKQELLYQEVTKLLSFSDGRITPEVFAQLRYLKCCLKESLRLHNLLPAAGRTTDHDIVLSGYRVPAKTMLAVILPELATDERYFKNAKQFQPERWLNREEKPQQPFVYLPFGFGPRSCLGRRLAELEIICLIVEIIQKYKVEYHHEDIDIFTRFINTPDKPLRFNFIERR